MNEKINELFDLIKANPDLPILPMVDHEIVAEDAEVAWNRRNVDEQNKEVPLH